MESVEEPERWHRDQEPFGPWQHGRFGHPRRGPFWLRRGSAGPLRRDPADRLAEHFADGRLDQAEFDDRVGRAMSAKTRADLSGLFSDLPETGAPAVPDHPHHPLRRRRHPVLIVVLLVLFIMATAHAVMWATMPWLWVAFLGLVLLFATGTIGRSRPGPDR